MPANNWHHLEVELILAETDKALLCRLEEGEEVWIPLFQIADADDYGKGDENCTISVQEWFARQRGWL